MISKLYLELEKRGGGKYMARIEGIKGIEEDPQGFAVVLINGDRVRTKHPFDECLSMVSRALLIRKRYPYK